MRLQAKCLHRRSATSRRSPALPMHSCSGAGRMSDRESWSMPDAAQVNIPGMATLDARMGDGAGPWSEIREAMCSSTFPTPAFRELLVRGELDVRWPLAFAAWAWYRGETGTSVNRECAELLSDGGLLETAWSLLEEYL